MLSSTETSLNKNDPMSALKGLDHSNKSAVKKAAVEFEASFLKNMMEHMFTGLDEGGTWGSGEGAEAWRGLLIDEYAKTISESGGIGLAQTVERQLLQLQESSQ
ncbi:MAG: rod-binding protein [Rhodobacteraceae bacterium]|nr:rod-binding protein [Paracoccaceae bacterium]